MQPAVTAPSNLLAGSFGEMGEVSIRYINKWGHFSPCENHGVGQWGTMGDLGMGQNLLRRVRRPGKAERIEILGSGGWLLVSMGLSPQGDRGQVTYPSRL